ncbi:unnamed protein product [Rotaria socialis]|uniref:Uncharacterized protein n=1 Tax=Rotaria socialis TaxID=392032 RepID=A0A821GT50_9BILA|nr:unnamed protein product [Rotaria socialis]CAF4674299.1 unnamed protein product [Rotaria socialis]
MSAAPTQTPSTYIYNNNNNSNNNNGNDNDNHSTNDKSAGHFARRRWSQALALADQLRRNTKLKRNEQLRQYAFEISSADSHESSVMASLEAQTDYTNSYQIELLQAKTSTFTLDSLTKNFIRLKITFNRMLDINKNELQQITLATSITKTALLILLRSIEAIVEIITKGTRSFPNLSSLISYIRSYHKELPIHGALLVEWYAAAHTLDLLVGDPDWLVQPRKAYWAMQVCNETLAWARVVFNENYRNTPVGRPIFDRDDSYCSVDMKDQD